MKIIISRPDNLGDVILTLPVCGVLKKNFPNCQIIFICKKYTSDIVKKCSHVDSAIIFDDLINSSTKDAVKLLKNKNADFFIHIHPNRVLSKLAKLAGIKNRIGNARRLYNFINCNIRLNIKKRRSPLHEAQLSLKLLKPLISTKNITLSEIENLYGLPRIENKIISKKFNLIIHPGSFGSAKNWHIDNFKKLIANLDQEKFNIYITGTQKENEKFYTDLISPFEKGNKVINKMGELSLSELYDFMGSCDGLVAASTGPMHLAAALGLKTLGLFGTEVGINPDRWGPIGKDTEVIIESTTNDTFLNISHDKVLNKVNSWVLNLV